jgi:serine/threonine-protein kinase
VIEFGQQLAQGLGAIHAQGIVHRDLKPTNIMVVRDGERAEDEAGAWRLKIIDFGVARTPLLIDQAATASGIFCGTAAYASPEQAGHGEGVDRRADLYALGCILWEMLAGHPPFRAEGLRELLQAHAVVPPPYDEIAHQPPSLTAILLRLLAKDPRERPADAAEVQRALERAKLRLTEEGGSRESTGLTQAFFRLAPAPEASTTAPLAARPTPWVPEVAL